MPMTDNLPHRAQHGPGTSTTDGGESLILAGAAGGSGNRAGGDIVIDWTLMQGSGSGRDGQVVLKGVPTADPNVPGALWNQGRVLLLSGAGGVPFTTMITCSDETTAITTSLVVNQRSPAAFTLTEARASLTTADNAKDTKLDITLSGTTIFDPAAPLQIDKGATTSVGSKAPSKLVTTAIPDNAALQIKVTQAGTVQAGLKVQLIGNIR